MAGYLSVLYLVLLTSFFLTPPPTMGAVPQPKQATLNQAQSDFIKHLYFSASKSYRIYLKSTPNDYGAWTRLGVCYVMIGQVQKGLATLRKVEKQTNQRSLNYFYQGISWDVLKRPDVALKYYEYTAQFTDENGSKAVFELGSRAYKARDKARAQKWLSSYVARFPHGLYRAKCAELLASLNAGKWLDDVPAIEKPDVEKANFQYHSWSFGPFPHFWLTQVGLASYDTDGWQPQPPSPDKPSISPRKSSEYGFRGNASIGVGPVSEKSFTAWCGYNYRQNWLIDETILNNFQENPADLGSFPLQPNNLERKHQFFGDVYRKFGDDFFLGAYGRVEYIRVGSSIFQSPDGKDVSVVTSSSERTLLAPWFGFVITDYLRGLFYLYMNKELVKNSPDLSNKSYDLIGSSGNRVMSYGLNISFDLKDYDLEGSLDLFQHEVIYNDHWLDNTISGGTLSFDYNFYEKLYLQLVYGMSNESFSLERIKRNDCEGVVTPSSPVTGSVQPCRRRESGSYLAAGVYWNYTSNIKFSTSYATIENRSNMKEFSERKTTVLADVTWAFPSVKRVSRYVERFPDHPFKREPR